MESSNQLCIIFLLRKLMVDTQVHIYNASTQSGEVSEAMRLKPNSCVSVEVKNVATVGVQ